MPTTIWTFTSNFEGWTFTDASTANASASRSHVSGAIRNNMIVIVGAGTRRATARNNSPTLNVTVANLDTIALDFGASSDALSTRVVMTANYTDLTSEFDQVIGSSGAGTLTLTLTQNKVLDNIEIDYWVQESGGVGSRNTNRDILEVRLTTAVAFIGTGERPLELDIDLAGGSKIWATKWKNGGLYLDEFSSGLVLQNDFPIATGTTSSVVDITNRTFYISPYAPPFFGTASLDDIIYIFGRWDDGGIEHLKKSVDGGSSFADIGDSGTWGADWVGAFFADDANILFAFVNGGSPALYRSINAGSSWTNLSSLPFDVDPGGVSKHPDGRILISNRDAGAQTAAYAEALDYSSWIDATGAPSFPTTTPGAGSNAIIWIT